MSKNRPAYTRIDREFDQTNVRLIGLDKIKTRTKRKERAGNYDGPIPTDEYTQLAQRLRARIASLVEEYGQNVDSVLEYAQRNKQLEATLLLLKAAARVNGIKGIKL